MSDFRSNYSLMEERISGLFKIHAAVFLFGLAGLFAEWVSLPASWIVLGRTGFAALYLMLALWLRKKTWPSPAHREIILLILSGALLAFHWVSFFQAIQLSSVALGLLTFSSFPVFTFLLELLVKSRRINLLDVLVVILTMLGVFWVIPPLNFTLTQTQGAMWGLASGLSFALLALLNRKLVNRFAGQQVALCQNFTAFLVLLPWALPSPQEPTLPDWGLLLLLGVVFTAWSHALFIQGLKRVSAGTASLIATLEPVYGIFAAWVLLKQAPSLTTLFGGVLIVGAAIFASFREK